MHVSLGFDRANSAAFLQGVLFVPERARQYDDLLWRNGPDLWTVDVVPNCTTLPCLLLDDRDIDTSFALTGIIGIRRAVSMDSGSYKSTSTCHGLIS